MMCTLQINIQHKMRNNVSTRTELPVGCVVQGIAVSLDAIVVAHDKTCHIVVFMTVIRAASTEH
jgi:hypothetical protein